MEKMATKISTQNSRFNWLNLSLVGILLLAAFLRLYKISDYMTFLGDEGRDVLIVKHLLEGDLVGLGPTASVGGFFTGPIYYYLMAPFLWLFRLNPVGPAIMVALFGIATVFLVFLAGKIFFNTKAGIIASALYTVSPVIIAFARSSWNPNPLPFFSLLAVLAIYQGVKSGRWWFFVFAGIMLGIALQLHYIALFL
ncbi:glycosyltransferase family 39 protein, partial [Candidatus Microgenomates bacterium]|nr:glycosyltransferase family 39 protein [Candidatus Microgenomates bacterium]